MYFKKNFFIINIIQLYKLSFTILNAFIDIFFLKNVEDLMIKFQKLYI